MNHHLFRSKPRVGFVSNKCNPSVELGLYACISSRITTVIHVASDYQINDNCFNEPFAVSPYKGLYLDMHGLIFETSIWLLAGSTRCLYSCDVQGRLAFTFETGIVPEASKVIQDDEWWFCYRLGIDPVPMIQTAKHFRVPSGYRRVSRIYIDPRQTRLGSKRSSGRGSRGKS